MRMKPGQLPASNTYVKEYCPYCGKHCYMSRKAAKKAARRIYPDQHMNAYKCHGSEFYHMTSIPERKKAHPSRRMLEYEERKRMERESFVEEALDAMYEKAERDGVAPVFTVEGKTWDEWGDLEETFKEEA